ncbi:unnamed protein product [Brassica napus]|uniref:(rape) hypothetical protein n=2 Tax=Brassica napus TaxID=3708 RepID=A0A816NY33_BRANA|nr:unnamed protein product [Brassica napus]
MKEMQAIETSQPTVAPPAKHSRQLGAQLSGSMSFSSQMSNEDEEMSRTALSAIMAKEEEIEKNKMEIRERVQAQLGRVEEETKRLAFIREELEGLAEPMRKEVALARKKIDSVNKELKNGLSKLGVPRNVLDLMFDWTGANEDYLKVPEAKGSIQAVRNEAFFIPIYELFLTYGGIFRLTFGPKSFLIVSDPSIAKHILKDNAKAYSKQTMVEMFPLRSADAAYGKIKAMLSTLGDPFTRIISPKEYQSFRIGSDGNLQGVGLFINSEPETGRLKLRPDLSLRALEASQRSPHHRAFPDSPCNYNDMLRSSESKIEERVRQILFRLKSSSNSFVYSFFMFFRQYLSLFRYVHLNPEIYINPKKRQPSGWEVHSTGIHAKTRYIPSFLFMKRSLSRERFCQDQDFHFSSSLTTEDGFNYAIVEDVGYEFKTIQLNQLVRRVLSCFDPKKFSVAVH